MTVHLKEEMFDTSIKKVHEHFLMIKEWLKTSDISDMEVLLSREYYCDKRLEVLLDAYIDNLDEIKYKEKTYNPQEEILPFGKEKCILLEFSSNRIQNEEFEIFINKALDAGLTPIIAHAERYPVIQNMPSDIERLITLGAYIQVNSESIISKRKTLENKTAKILVGSGKVDFISSDSHDLQFRSPNLKKCYSYSAKRYGKKTADKLFRDNASFLIYGK